MSTNAGTPSAFAVPIVILLVALAVLAQTFLLAPPAKAATRNFYSLCADTEIVNVYDTEQTPRRYRFTGDVDDCGTDWGANCNNIVQASIFLVNDGLTSDEAGVFCGDINDWQHGNVVAMSRCRHVLTSASIETVLEGFNVQADLSCSYLRH